MRREEGPNTVKISYVFKSGADMPVHLPGKFEVCDRCEGRGKHVNPAIDEHGLSRDDFDQDPDFEEAYFSGRYDVRCYDCNGLRVMPVVDEQKLTKREKVLYDSHCDRLADDASYAWEASQERRMGA